MKSTRYTFIVQRLATILAVSILSLSWLAAITGILLAFYYSPAAGGAFESMQQITTKIPSGWLIRSLHDISGNGLIAVSLVQIVVMFLGRHCRPSWLIAWVGGILLTLVAIALGWSAMALDWSQVGYWRFSLELETIKAIPWMGSQLRDILTGGDGIATVTLQHLYALHSYVLSMAALMLSIIHLVGLLMQERNHQHLQALQPETETNAISPV
ncbi:MAG: cytochrome bc complex cytochrome b subunit [Cyanothece sp. SIO1E1]|nr:cytochrome bc complex cytochrome b subunit [Cyanothece sp. SIO1E1]